MPSWSPALSKHLKSESQFHFQFNCVLLQGSTLLEINIAVHISDILYRYLDLGGSEERGMRALAASYVGLPNMVNAMIELLHAAGYRKREIQSMVEEHLKSLVLRHFDPKKADLIFTEEGSVSTYIDMAKFMVINVLT